MKSYGEQAVAEFVGTLALVFIGAGSVVALRPLGAAAILGIALAHGLVLAVMVSNLGHISGGHFNPAVTVGAWVTGKIETLRAGFYIVCQLAGAVAGAGLLRWAIPERIWRAATLGATLVDHTDNITNAKAVLLEGILTFFLVFTVFAAAIDDRGAFKSIAGLSIGLVLTFDILVGGFLTGASMNPARSFGPALVAAKWDDFWVYVAGPLSGAVIAGAVYWFSFLRGRQVAAPREEVPIGGGPEENLP
ncbi:MAG TPA: MIP family channel protein [Actinomycetota bacterium]|nr:MIP family channel protein [Actinomycetota bacterium]